MRSGPYGAGKKAEGFLRRALAQGPKPVPQLVEMAAKEKISRATLYRAAKRLRVERIPTGQGRYRWALPQEICTPDETATPVSADAARPIAIQPEPPVGTATEESAPVEKISAGEQPAPIAAAEAPSVVGKQQNRQQPGQPPPATASPVDDRRVKWAAEEVIKLIRAGMSQESALFQACCPPRSTRHDADLMRQVRAALDWD